jgi:hypothetical protein
MKRVVAFAAAWPEADRSTPSSWQQHGATGWGSQQERTLRRRAGDDSEQARASPPVHNAPRAAMQAVSKSQDRNRQAGADIEKSSPHLRKLAIISNLSYQDLQFGQANWELEALRRRRIRIATAASISLAGENNRCNWKAPACVSRSFQKTEPPR